MYKKWHRQWCIQFLDHFVEEQGYVRRAEFAHRKFPKLDLLRKDIIGLYLLLNTIRIANMSEKVIMEYVEEIEDNNEVM
jgi:hypothetical protein